MKYFKDLKYLRNILKICQKHVQKFLKMESYFAVLRFHGTKLINRVHYFLNGDVVPKKMHDVFWVFEMLN